MERKYFISGIIFGLIAILIGAFGAHGLKPLLTPESLTTLEIGVKYQMYHALLLILLGILISNGHQFSKAIFYLLFIGVVLFSGSIYLLATNELTNLDFRALALATPLGGSLLIISWAWLLVYFIKLKKK